MAMDLTQMTLTSPAFEASGLIPPRYTCSGADQSPPLAWSGTPAGTASFALIVDDPDARGFIHWVAYDLPGDSSSLPGNAARSAEIAQGRNSFGSIGWRGPCPPSGVHRYDFTLFALDTSLSLSGDPSAADVRAAMRGHILGQATLTGRFGR
jgi:Raf kinase inhibitor-like YbhB/YbcL family protein